MNRFPWMGLPLLLLLSCAPLEDEAPVREQEEPVAELTSALSTAAGGEVGQPIWATNTFCR